MLAAGIDLHISYTKALGHLGGGGGGSIEPLPFTFETIHPIDLIFGTYNELS